MKRNVEILAPAGSPESLKAGICAGADAVYIGGQKFGARAYADNPDEKGLLQAIDYAHLHERKIYLTVNTLLKDGELGELYDYLLPYYKAGLDAVIIQDTGVLRTVREYFPDMSVHVSTQATVTHALGAELFKRMGADRIVPARELSLSEIQNIKAQTGLEVECFVHGAMCYCYSGQCLLSSMIGGRSGNRGQCAQPCRLPYSVKNKAPQDLLSLKDMCTIDILPELIDAGIDSFKIEGRMKQPEYVYEVVRMYRKYADLYLTEGRNGYFVDEEDRKRLEGAYKRRGYCSGYYYRQNGKDMISLKRPAKNKEEQKEKTDYEIKEKINGKLILSEGKHAKLYLEYKNKKRNICVVTEGGRVQTALKAPLSPERIEAQMKKTGNTEFVFDTLDIQTEGSVFMPMQALNELRRNGLSSLMEKTKASYERTEIPGGKSKFAGQILRMKAENGMEKKRSLRFTVSVHNYEQLEEITVLNGIDTVFVDARIAFEKETLELTAGLRRGKETEVYVSMPYIFRQRAVIQYEDCYEILLNNYDGVLIRNWESYEWLRKKKYPKKQVSDCNLYAFNRESRSFLKECGFDGYTMPAELNEKELGILGADGMLIVYGYQPVMITANCVRRTTEGCKQNEGILWLRDRYQKKFAVKNYCRYCYNVIYNCSPLMLLSLADEVRALCPAGIRLDFTVEGREEVRDITELYQKAFLAGENVRVPDIDYTKGHFKRGVK